MSGSQLQAPGNAISVIVCTCDRGAGLLPTVRSVLAAADALPAGDNSRFELLVIDQSAGDDVHRALAQIAAHYTQLRYVRETSTGLSAARNAGLRLATGDFLAFTDDDCTAETEWLKALRQVFVDHPDVGVVFGHVACAPHDSTSGYLPGFNAHEGPLTQTEMLTGAGTWGMGANMALRRSAWQTIGDFDEMLGAGAPLRSSEDVDYALRAVECGIGVYRSAQARLVHHGFRSRNQASHLMRGAAIGMGAMYAKHVRAGERLSRRLWRHELTGRTRDVLRNLRELHRPVGANAVRYQLAGYRRGIRLPITSTGKAGSPIFRVGERTTMSSIPPESVLGSESGTSDTRHVELAQSQPASAVPFFSVIIPVWNRCEDLRDTLLQLRRQTYDRYEVLVVDNASTEPVSDMVREQYPEVRLFRLDENRGPVVARNLGMREARGELVLFLDSDTIPEDEALAKLARKLTDEPDLGVVSGLQYDATTGRPWWWWTQHGFTEEQWLHVELETPFKFAEGAAAARKDVVLGVGGFPEDFFIAAEGRDVAARVTDAGYRVIYWPDVTFLHKPAQRLKTNRWYRSDGRLYFEFRNEFWYTVKYFPLPLLTAKTVLNLGRNLRRAWEYRAFTEFLRAYRDALVGLPRNLRQRHVLKPATIYKITSGRYKRVLGPLTPGHRAFAAERSVPTAECQEPVAASGEHALSGMTRMPSAK